MPTHFSRLFKVCLTAMVLLAFTMGFFAWRSFDTLVARTNLVEHSYQVISSAQLVDNQLAYAVAGQRGFLLSHDKSFLALYTTGVQALLKRIDNVEVLTHDNPLQAARVDSLRLSVISLLNALKLTLNYQQTVASAPGYDRLLERDKVIMEEARGLVSRIILYEQRLRAQRAEAADAIVVATRWLTYSMAALVSLLALTLALYTFRKLQEQAQHQAQLSALNQEINSANQELAVSNEELMANIESLEDANRTIEQLRVQERQRSRNLFEALVNSLPQWIWIFDAEKRIRFINRRGIKAIARPADDLLGKVFTEVADPPVPEQWQQELLRTYDTKAPSQLELDFPRGDKTGTAILNFIPLLHDSGEIDQVVAMAYDITTRKQAEAEIAKSLREKQILLSEIHHRVKNNLSIISGLLQLQASKSRNPEISFALSESINRIYAMSLIHEKLYKSDLLSHINLSGYVRELVGTIQLVYHRENLKLDILYNIEGVYVDILTAVPLGLILNELITNAYKHAFTGRDRGVILITILPQGEELILEVGDDGVGLPEAFDPKRTSSLGWSLIDGLTRQLKGTLTVTREPNTVFKIQFRPSSIESTRE